jgi:hypothetical protein
MIKIEVTGNSIDEVADKLLAIGTSLRSPTFGHQFEHKTLTLGNAKIEETVFEPDVTVGKAHDAPLADAGRAEPEPTAVTTEATSSAPTATASPSEPTVSSDALKTLVLTVVREKGRDAMIAVLDTFGVGKATDVPAEQVPELVAALEALI